MAKETIVLLKDDLDGSAAETTVQFGWNGATYEIDLSNANADALATAIAPYLAAARRVAGRRARGPASSAARTSRRGDDSVAVRAWAAQNGFQVADRGRISRAVIDAYHNATSSSPSSAQISTESRKPGRQPTRRRRAAKKAPAKKAAPAAAARRRRARKTT